MTISFINVQSPDKYPLIHRHMLLAGAPAIPLMTAKCSGMRAR